MMEKVDPQLVDDAINHIERNIEAHLAGIANVVEQQINSEESQTELPATEIVQKATKQIADHIIRQVDTKKIVKKQSSAATGTE
jgi:vacuolar-type H+-ATPase subunit H